MHSFISDNAIFLQLQYKVVCNYVSKNIKIFPWNLFRSFFSIFFRKQLNLLNWILKIQI